MSDRNSKPTFVDNREGRTLSRAIRDYLEYLNSTLANSPDLDIVTGYFNPRGYFSVSDEIKDIGNVRLLIGADPGQKDEEEWRKPDDPIDDSDYHENRVESALQSLDESIERDRNLLGFSRETSNQLQDLVDYLNSDSIQVRRYEDGFVHGKAYLFAQDGVIAGSSNFTGAGLNSNLELNLGHYNPRTTEEVREWFEELWDASEPYDLASVYEEQFQPYEPYLIFLRVLYERYGHELEEEREMDDGINLANFQEDGVRRAERFLERHDGTIIADEVGLGKTYIGLELLRKYTKDARQHAVVVAPAYLRDGMWSGVRREEGLNFDILSYSELREEPKLGGDAPETSLRFDPDDYQLVVIDEAHAFRNPGTKQSQALRRLLRGSPPKDVVMLTATPVNNSLWDLYYLISYFIKNDAEFASEGIRSLRDRFKMAQAQDPSDLSPNLLFDILDQTTVRRTRRFISQHYDRATLPDGKGGEIRVTFPDSHPHRIDYEFDETFGDGFFDDVALGLGGREDNDPELTLARYRPSYYIEGEEDESELSLVGLLRSGLLKRFESSSHAFATTLDRMISQNQAALELLDNGYVPQTDAIEEWVESDNDEAFREAFEEVEDTQLRKLDRIPADAEINQLRKDLNKDIKILSSWYERAEGVSRNEDEKLHALRDTLIDISDDAANDAETAPESYEEAFRQNRKVLIFSYYEDTVDWVVDYLEEVVQENEELSCYEGRIAAVVGDDTKRGISQQDAVHGFAPDTTDAPDHYEDKYDILVATDVLGQGVNLQQARNVINYDLPWNPMRVVQRNGRIDRVGSPHTDIYPRTFFPEDRLNELLQLEGTVRRKLTQAAHAVGMDSEVIPGMDTVEKNFADRAREIKAIHNEDEEVFEQGGKKAAAFSGEEYRQLLREGMEEREEEISNLPWGAGSGFRGENPGYFFTARVGDEVYLRFVPIEWDSGEDVIDDSLTCLRYIECTADTPREIPEKMKREVYEAWETAKDDMHRDWLEQTDPRNIEPDIPKIFRDVGDHLESYPPEGYNEDEIVEAVKAIQAPTGKRYGREFRDIYKNDGLGPQEKSAKFLDKVDELGLQPFEPPTARPRIEEEQIKLVCWMAVVPKSAITKERLEKNTHQDVDRDDETTEKIEAILSENTNISTEEEIIKRSTTPAFEKTLQDFTFTKVSGESLTDTKRVTKINIDIKEIIIALVGAGLDPYAAFGIVILHLSNSRKKEVLKDYDALVCQVAWELSTTESEDEKSGGVIPIKKENIIEEAVRRSKNEAGIVDMSREKVDDSLQDLENLGTIDIDEDGLVWFNEQVEITQDESE